jgi:hypothetical protein
MNHTPHFATLEGRGDDIGGLLALIERGCARMMKQGGGALGQTQPHWGGLKPGVKKQILGYARQGVSLKAIASRFHCHYGTVVKVTRPLRGLKPAKYHENDDASP